VAVAVVAVADMVYRRVSGLDVMERGEGDQFLGRGER
jgi:hypothetical protein